MGIFLMQSCDYRIGVNGKFRYTANEVAIGMAMPFSTIEILKQRLTPTAVSRAILLAEIFTPENAVQNGVIDLVVDEAELMSTAIAFAQSTSNLNAVAHSLSKKRLRAPIIAAIREGLAKDDEGWKKQFIA
jgi:enoyl-CoA hydratase